jgi:immune inhibitor A
MNGRALRILLIVVIFLLVLAPPALAAVTGNGSVHDPLVRSDKLADPLTTNQESLKQTALKAKINGKVSGNVAEVARGQYVELARESEGEIWTVLGEFKDFPHNSIEEPDRAVNNTTVWVPDFNRDYFMDLLFNEAWGQLDEQLLHRAVVQPLRDRRRCDRLDPMPGRRRRLR